MLRYEQPPAQPEYPSRHPAEAVSDADSVKAGIYLHGQDLEQEVRDAAVDIGDDIEAHQLAEQAVEAGDFSALSPADAVAFRVLAKQAEELGPGETQANVAARKKRLAAELAKKVLEVSPQEPRKPGTDFKA